jgi:GNAT superfamily N-acetyltransferase
MAPLKSSALFAIWMCPQAAALRGVAFGPVRPSDMPQIRSALASARMNPLFVERERFVAARDSASDRLAGAVQLRPLGTEGGGGARAYELASLFVEPEYRGRGIGQGLVRQCLDRAQRAPADAPAAAGSALRGAGAAAPSAEVFLLTLATRAEFYERLGFEAVADVSRLPATLLVECALGQVVR